MKESTILQNCNFLYVSYNENFSDLVYFGDFISVFMCRWFLLVNEKCIASEIKIKLHQNLWGDARK